LKAARLAAILVEQPEDEFTPTPARARKVNDNEIIRIPIPGSFLGMRIVTAAALPVLGALMILTAPTGAAQSPAGEVPQLPAVVPARPKAGPVEIFPLAGVKPGVKGIAWTVFQGTEAEAVPVELIGLWKNAWGPRQDVILAKLGARRCERTSRAG
jgi:hypothetical protein